MKIKLTPIWLWIKQYQHPLRVLGDFFGAALIAAFWISGFDIEPIAFALGMLSSLFLASPSVAEYFYQNVNLSEI